MNWPDIDDITESAWASLAQYRERRDRVRGVQAKIVITSNPAGPNWIKDLFMNEQEQWMDLCRKRFDTTEQAKASMVVALDLIGRTAQGALNRKLDQGYEALEPMTMDRVWLVEVIQSTLPEVTGAGPGAKFLEVRHTCKIRKLP